MSDMIFSNYNVYIICQLCIGTGSSTADSRGVASRVQALSMLTPPSITYVNKVIYSSPICYSSSMNVCYMNNTYVIGDKNTRPSADALSVY